MSKGDYFYRFNHSTKRGCASVSEGCAVRFLWIPMRLIKCNNVFRAEVEAAGSGNEAHTWKCLALSPYPLTPCLLATPVADTLPLANLHPPHCHLLHFLRHKINRIKSTALTTPVPLTCLARHCLVSEPPAPGGQPKPN